MFRSKRITGRTDCRRAAYVTSDLTWSCLLCHDTEKALWCLKSAPRMQAILTETCVVDMKGNIQIQTIFNVFDTEHKNNNIIKYTYIYEYIYIYIYIHDWIYIYIYTWLNQWSSDQSSCLQIQKAGFDFRRFQIFWEVLGLERGPLSLVSTTEELPARNSSDSGLEDRECGRRDSPRWPRDTLY
jgi:hypothetical protein